MNLNDIKMLMQEFDASGIHKFELEIDTMKLKMAKEPAAKVVAALPTASTVVAAPVQEAATPVIGTAPEAAAPLNGVPVKSPVVGTFYQASAPDAEPFVTVGQQVKKGQTLCIVEAMKMMNEITAPVSGTVTEILVKDEDMVEFDQVIMLIRE
jgi:acetyl-CoA carboxylase biotin carboxyl carrier protein